MNSVAELLQDYLNHVSNDPEHAFLDLQKLPEDFQELGKSLALFCEDVIETGALAKAIAKGNLNIQLPPPDNELAAPLKNLHAALKHLTWQSQQVAKGDYHQRVDFMGDFAEAFNTMVEQLEQQRLALLEQIQAMRERKSLYEMLVEQIEQRIIVIDSETAEILFVSRTKKDTAPTGDKDCEEELLQWLKRQTELMRGKSEIFVTEFEQINHAVVCNYSVSIHPLYWNEHNALAFVLTDVSTQTEQLKKLQNIANVDILTQLYNRRYGMETLEQWISEEKRFVLCFIDIDNLKFVNDEHGHAEGDRYISCVAGSLRQFSLHSVICRIGGDEFLLLAEDWDPQAAEERLDALRKWMLDSSSTYERSISYGVIPVTTDNTLQASDLLNAADEKMYEYKRAYKLRQKNRQQDVK